MRENPVPAEEKSEQNSEPNSTGIIQITGIFILLEIEKENKENKENQENQENQEDQENQEKNETNETNETNENNENNATDSCQHNFSIR